MLFHLAGVSYLCGFAGVWLNERLSVFVGRFDVFFGCLQDLEFDQSERQHVKQPEVLNSTTYCGHYTYFI